ncbi:MAG TPA: YwqG family protein [Candidatus Dormibacteraeota bacterium]|jgi:hypothetical protein
MERERDSPAETAEARRLAESVFAATGEVVHALTALEGLRPPELEALWDEIAGFARPSARLVVAGDVAGGVSKLGGLPRVDDAFEWPRDPHGAPLPCLGQIDLGQVHQVCWDPLLPEGGVLSLFYDANSQPGGYRPSDRGRWAIRHSPVESRLALAPPEVRVFPEVHLGVIGDLTLPENDSIEIQSLQLDRDQADAYESVLQSLELRHSAGRTRPIHRALGWPGETRHDPAIAAQLASNGVDAGDPGAYRRDETRRLLDGRRTWRLIAQIDSEESAQMLSGMYGPVYFLMREGDIRDRAWDQAWATMQRS